MLQADGNTKLTKLPLESYSTDEVAAAGTWVLIVTEQHSSKISHIVIDYLSVQ